MEGFFSSKKLAIIGASPNPNNLTRIIIHNCILFDFKGEIYPVGIRPGAVLGHRIHPSVEDLPDGIDLALILTPAKTVPAYLEACGRKGIKRVVIESGGFGEFSKESEPLEQAMLETAQKYGMRFIGPNGIGVISTHSGLCLPFGAFNAALGQGDISLLTQSGGVGIELLFWMKDENLGLNKFVSLGNKLNVNEADLLEYLITDDTTHIIFMYLESIPEGRKIFELARSTSKPIIVLKANISQAGKKIAASHTKALANDEEVVDAALNQAGIIRVHSVHEFINAVKVLTLPPMTGKRLAIVSRSGGHAVITTDAADKNGFEFPDFPEDVFDEVAKYYRAGVIKLQNPLDLGDIFDFSTYINIIRAIAHLDVFDGILFLHLYRSLPDVEPSRNLIPAIKELSAKVNKPIVTCFVTTPDETMEVKKRFSYPLFSDPVDAANALALAQAFNKKKRIIHSLPKVSHTWDTARISELLSENDGLLPMDKAFQVIELIDIPIVKYRFAKTPDEARRQSSSLTPPYALKADSKQIVHKSDVGAVQIKLESAESVSIAAESMAASLKERIPAAQINGFLIQEMAPRGLEVIIGGRRDAHFGPVILFGLGGIYVEAVKDVSVRLAPIGMEEALELIDSTLVSKILHGTRGREGYDIEAIQRCLVSLSHLLYEHPRIQEVDLNPIRVYPKGRGILAIDARIIT